jgi:hypothetical protein
MQDDQLSAKEILMLIEGLDALIPVQEGRSTTWLHASPEEHERWDPYRSLRAKLKRVVHVSFYDNARGWLDMELARERIALTDKLHTRLAQMLRDPKATRTTVKDGFVAAIRELREERQSTPRPLS